MEGGGVCVCVSSLLFIEIEEISQSSCHRLLFEALATEIRSKSAASPPPCLQNCRKRRALSAKLLRPASAERMQRISVCVLNAASPQGYFEPSGRVPINSFVKQSSPWGDIF